jgi:hypothetical protein
MRDEETGGWKKLRNEELHNLYSSPSIFRVIKSRRLRWALHLAQMGGEEELLIGYWWESQKERPLGRPRCWWLDIKMYFR